MGATTFDADDADDVPVGDVTPQDARADVPTRSAAPHPRVSVDLSALPKWRIRPVPYNPPRRNDEATYYWRESYDAGKSA